MSHLKRVSPSPSYFLSVPDVTVEDYEGRVCSLWEDGKELLLQLSSNLRSQGDQVSAKQRLQERVKKHSGDWKVLPEGLHPDRSVDQATAECLDERRDLWIHTYLVWPHLTVYALISGPESEVRDPASWPKAALKSIELSVH